MSPRFPRKSAGVADRSDRRVRVAGPEGPPPPNAAVHQPSKTVVPPAATRWSTFGRGTATAFILLYLLHVAMPPLAGPPPSSALAATLIQPLRPLVGALYLGHGYRFFAPDPGPGHAIRWSMRMPDGSTRVGMLPDPAVDRPRLLYHRRFMIAEKISGMVPSADAPPDVRREARARWQPLVMGVAGRLLRREGGSEVELTMVEFDLPTPEDSIAGRSAPDVETGLGTYALSTPPREARR